MFIVKMKQVMLKSNEDENQDMWRPFPPSCISGLLAFHWEDHNQ